MPSIEIAADIVHGEAASESSVTHGTEKCACPFII